MALTVREIVEYTLGGGTFLVVVLLFMGQILGQPVGLGFVETGSMAPTLNPNDGFIAVPMAIAGPVEKGDVIVFRAEEIQGGGLTTHRVVGRTDQGFITKGDANPVTDQAGGEPPVTRGKIVAKALQVGGSVVVIPNLGLLVTGVNGVLTTVQRQLAAVVGTRALLGTQGLAYIILGVGVVIYAGSELLTDERRQRSGRSRRQDGLASELIIGGLTLILVVILTVSMVAPAGAQNFTIVSSQSDSPGIGVIGVGESENITYAVPSNGLIPTIVYLEPRSEGVSINDKRLVVPSGGQVNATVTLSAPDTTGSFTRSFVERRYLLLLPTGLIDSLYRIHPWLPIVAIDVLVGIGFAAIATGLVGFREVRTDSRGPSLWVRLRRRFR